MNLPAAIVEYFRLMNISDDAGALALFATDAVVIDSGEGKELHGLAEIQDWITPLSKLDLKTEIQGAEEQEGEWVLDTVISGAFKASPARFKHFITLVDEKISAYRSEFLGSAR